MSGRDTFYDLLEVDGDANEETVRRAYRAQVKEHHPDVSDHPDARARFKRLTLARNVLCDRTERARYDRLGHESYLATRRAGGPNHDGTTGTAGTTNGGQGTGSGPAAGSTGASARSASATGSAGSSHRSASGRSSASAGTTGTSQSAGSAGTADSRGSTTVGGTRGGGRTASGDAESDGSRVAHGSRASHSPRGGNWAYGGQERAGRTAPESEATSPATDSDAVTAVVLLLIATVVVGLALVAGGVVPVDAESGGVMVGGWVVVATIAGWMVLGG